MVMLASLNSNAIDHFFSESKQFKDLGSKQSAKMVANGFFYRCALC